MKPKYTTEALRQKIAQDLLPRYADEVSNRSALSTGAGNDSLDEDEFLDEIISLFTAQQAALLDEVEKRLPKTTMLEYEDSPELENKKLGYNEAINQVTETLEAIKKEIV